METLAKPADHSAAYLHYTHQARLAQAMQPAPARRPVNLSSICGGSRKLLITPQGEYLLATTLGDNDVVVGFEEVTDEAPGGREFSQVRITGCLVGGIIIDPHHLSSDVVGMWEREAELELAK